MNIKHDNVKLPASNKQNQEEIFFTIKLVKSGLGDMLWQLSLLYRIGKLCNYTYVYTPFSLEKRYQLSLIGKIIKKIETTVNQLLKIDRYSEKISRFIGFERFDQNINNPKFTNYKIVEIPISKVYQEENISNIEDFKKHFDKFVAGVTPSSKKIIYSLTFTPELYEHRRAFRLDDLFNNADTEQNTLQTLKLQLSKNYQTARKNRPVNIPFDEQKIKIVIHLRKGDRMLVNLRQKVIGVFSSQVKIFDSTSNLDEWESNNYSNSHDTHKAFDLLQKIFCRYKEQSFSIIVISDGYERTFQNIRHAMLKGELRLSQEEKRELTQMEITANREFDVFSNYSNVSTIIGESEQKTFQSIHAIVCADIIIKTTGGFAWVLNNLFKKPDHDSSIFRLGQDDDLAIDKIENILASKSNNS